MIRFFHFTTLGQAIILTNTITGITSTSAISGGNITSDGGAIITTRGVCWASTANPTVSDSKTTDGSGAGSFTSSIIGLNQTTTYYVRAYASNSAGSSYGNQLIFATKGTLTDFDGNIYKTIKIGSQVWMAENLRTTKYNDGTNIPLKAENAIWSLDPTPGYCWYNNTESSFRLTYGALYNWYTVNTDKLCPVGWHVSADADWVTLTSFLGDESMAGCILKETGTIHWKSPNFCATNEQGFMALPGGLRDGAGVFYDVGINGFWWTSTGYNNSAAWFRMMTHADSWTTRRNDFHKSIGLSVRCVRDN